MRWREHNYEVEIVTRVDRALAQVTTAQLEEAEEDGYLAGNAMYRSLEGLAVSDLTEAIGYERCLIERLVQAEDLEAEAESLEDERLEAFEPVEELWGLDLGVASATVAVVVLGGLPVGSCNAGGFGGRHQASHPYVAFFLPESLVDKTLGLAHETGVGLLVDGDGLAQLYADRDLALLGFAEAVLRSLSA